MRAKPFILEVPPTPLASVPAFMSGQYIPTSFTVIILFLHSGSLRAGSSFGHTPLCFHNLIGFLRKEGCISLTLPASCCVQQQTKAPPRPPSPCNQEVSFHWNLLFCRGIILLNTSAASSSLLSLKLLQNFYNRELRLKLKLQLRGCATGLLLGGVHWNAS